MSAAGAGASAELLTEVDVALVEVLVAAALEVLVVLDVSAALSLPQALAKSATATPASSTRFRRVGLNSEVNVMEGAFRMTRRSGWNTRNDVR